MCDLAVLQTLPSLGYPLVMYSYSRCSTCELQQERNFEMQFQATSFRWSNPEFCFISLHVLMKMLDNNGEKIELEISSLNALHTSLPSKSCLKDCSPLRGEITILEVWIYSWCFSLASKRNIFEFRFYVFWRYWQWRTYNPSPDLLCNCTQWLQHKQYQMVFRGI